MRPVGGLRTALAILAWACFAPAAVPAAARGGYPEHPSPVHWPGEGGKTVRVKLGMYLIDFARVNIREESFDVAGYLDTSWTDPSLALKPGGAPAGVRRYRPGEIWSPELEFVNAVEQVKAEREGDLYVDGAGGVVQRVRFSHKFSASLDLKRFPFDRQVLTIVVAPFDTFARDIDLVVDRGRVGRLKDVSVSDWDILGVDARTEAPPGGDPSETRFLFEVKVKRKSNFYTWRVLLPLTLLVLASWTVFWFDPTSLQPMISTGLAILLSLTTFNYAIDFSLPKVAYLTFIDRYVIASFAFVLSVTFAVAAIHVTFRARGEGAAARLQRLCRAAFPFAYVASLLSVVWSLF